MTFSPPAEARVFRGETLSPASPRPVHIPEPATIPVLQNQTDLLFNQMSTHMDSPTALKDATNLPYGSFGNAVTADTASYLLPAENRKDGPSGVGNSASTEHESDDITMSYEDDGAEKERESFDTSQNQSSFAADPFSSLAYDESLSGPTLGALSSKSSEPNLPPSEILSHHHDNPPEPFQEGPEPTLATNDDRVLSSASELEPSKFQSAQLYEHGGEDVGISGSGVNYEAILEGLSPSTSIAPVTEGKFATTTELLTETLEASASSNVTSPNLALPTHAGLPPRPPPQEKPAIHPNYTTGEDIRSYHAPRTQNTPANPSYAAQPSKPHRPAQTLPHSIVAAGAPGTSSTPNGLPPPPLATFQQPPPSANQAQNSPPVQNSSKDNLGKNGIKATGPADGDSEARWGPEVQNKYDEFLHDERIYVNEGLWDRFPSGSRLFIGNLPTELVTKRDLFHIFHKYGKLAQVSIKQAYGFVQYLEASCCQRALQNEQGGAIKGRKMHLEISKPQKNSRNAAPTSDGDRLRAGSNRRSRSPDYGRGRSGASQRMSGDRYERGVPFSDFRDEPRRVRDDYRPGRSPSPRGFRGRDEYRGLRNRSPDRYIGSRRSRSRSPYSKGHRYRSRSPRQREADEDLALPLPKRETRDVPDVQLILMEDVDRAFVSYVQKSFNDRGLRCEYLKLPRVPLAAVVRRQILEGVQAVIKLTRNDQLTGKIPLQVFDRRAGVNNVRFDEYDNLDTHIAVELVVRAKSTHVAPIPVPVAAVNYNAPTQAYTAPQYSQNAQAAPQQQPHGAAPPNLANLITSLDGPALQKLLGAMAQSPQTPQTPQAPQQRLPPQHQLHNQSFSQPSGGTPDLAALLGSVSRQSGPHQQAYQYPQQHQQQQYQQQSPQNAPYALQGAAPFMGNPGLSSLLNSVSNRPAQASIPNQQQQFHEAQQQPPSQQHVQNLMEQLAKWKQ